MEPVVNLIGFKSRSAFNQNLAANNGFSSKEARPPPRRNNFQCSNPTRSYVPPHAPNLVFCMNSPPINTKVNCSEDQYANLKHLRSTLPLKEVLPSKASLRKDFLC
jgi:hypothetical protein